MQNFTTEDLLLYLYNEMKELEKAALENELQNNWSLKEKFQVLKEAKNRLQKLQLHSPLKRSIDSILQYANHVLKVSS
ncbi:MAG: hypothetical protein ACR2FN_03725 [Chitinophagaceae bacterium]